MRILILVILYFPLFASCNKIFKERENVNVEAQNQRDYLVGADKDENGCVSSAGYTWSVLKNDCIRIFEIGYRLNPVNQNPDEAVISAFVLFNESKDKVELFLPTSEKSIVLDKKADASFENGNFKFNSNDFYLTIDGIKTYEAAKEDLKNIDDLHEEI